MIDDEPNELRLLGRIADALERIAAAMESRPQNISPAIADIFEGTPVEWWEKVWNPIHTAVEAMVARLVWPKGGNATVERSWMVRRVTRAAAGDKKEMRTLASGMARLRDLDLLDFLRLPTFVPGSEAQNYRERVIQANTPKAGSN